MRLTAAVLALLIAAAALMQGCGGESGTATGEIESPPKAPHSELIEGPPAVPGSA
jgi:hypothetical protein